MWGVLMGSPDEGVVERSELYILAGEDGVKKMMNINANKNIGDGGNENILSRRRGYNR